MVMDNDDKAQLIIDKIDSEFSDETRFDYQDILNIIITQLNMRLDASYEDDQNSIIE